ncbi:MAG: hypothetical protein S4CHLAM123_00830 [Chlamydiales bacterium]|nr:hypothetical protein [Chlamydiales bacterium]
MQVVFLCYEGMTALDAVFLASEESAWMAGQVMTVDGGQSLSFYKWTTRSD